MLAPRAGLHKRPRVQTDEDFVIDAKHNASMLRRRALVALDFPESAAGATVADVAARRGVTSSEISAARAAARDARSCALSLAAAAPSFSPGLAADLAAASAQLADAAALAAARADAYAPFAIVLGAGGESAVKSELTADERAMLADPPVLVNEPAAGSGAGAAYAGVSDADAEKLRVMYVEWRWPQTRIAEVMCCSERKARSLLADLGLQRAPDTPRIREVIIEAKNAGMSLGMRRIEGVLAAEGTQSTGRAVLAALHELDAVGLEQRKRHAVPRVAYNVRAVNELWHFDGNELLVRWKFWIHGVIDGASRFVVSLSAADNKYAPTVQRLMANAMAAYGVPRKVRADEGKENVDVISMCDVLSARGYRISYIPGPSVHNQKIERFWGDLSPFTHPIAACFEAFEANGHLNAGLLVHIVALHLVFMPYVTEMLEFARTSWAAHRVSTRALRCSPRDYFARGLAQNERLGTAQVLFVDAAGAWVEPPGTPAAANVALAGSAPVPCAMRAAAHTVDVQEKLQGEWMPWLSPAVRARIYSHLVPLRRGQGVLYEEGLPRFLRALNLVTALHAHAIAAGAVTERDVDAAVAMGL